MRPGDMRLTKTVPCTKETARAARHVARTTWVDTVTYCLTDALRLERDAWSMVIILWQARNEYHPPPPPAPGKRTGGHRGHG